MAGEMPPESTYSETHSCSSQRNYRIGGISVEFPYKAYGSQLAYMGKVVTTLERSQRQGNGQCHALLESPTGTGKSLALLCATLAWQKHFKAFAASQLPSPSLDAPGGISSVESVPGTLRNHSTAAAFSMGGGFIAEDVARSGAAEDKTTKGAKPTCKKPKTPTIFYATRTHSQITQVLREYRKTSYRVPMAILAARKHYCTNKNVCKKKNVDEECKLLLKDPDHSCFQFKNVHKVKSHASLQKGGTHEIHDIEDLVGVSHSVKGCAYFAARSMALDAHIVFCPYGYLLNPLIRKAMEINLQGAIVVLDEAHNIEDVAREAGSINLQTTTLEAMRIELEQLSIMGPSADFYQPLLELVQEMLSWIYQKGNSLEKHDFEHYSSCWSDEEALQELQSAGISFQSFPMLSECANKAVGAASDLESKNSHLSGFAAGALEGLFSALNYMLKENAKHLGDYRLVVEKYVKRDEELGVTGWICSLNLWCLNPAVVFEEIASKAKSVILTSGTLSPMCSFASELGVSFDVCMEAPHIIDMKSQVWAASVPKGPGNVPLNASYKYADGYAFQDALGSALEELFKVSPDGALVFFPSYKLLEKLCNRWKATGQWIRLSQQKHLFIEPRGKMETFDAVLVEYYKAVNGKATIIDHRSKQKPSRKKSVKDQITQLSSTKQMTKGAAFLAVCRGKVSEGLNFSDQNARMVIVVGIPFPNKKDLQVNMKRQYNSKNKVCKGLLSGDEWYCHQAFRALNQAVGRCIRHRQDYGAIILLDERFQKTSNLDYLSKWLRKSIQQIETFENSCKGLQSFFQRYEVSSLKNEKNTANNFNPCLKTFTAPVKDCKCRSLKLSESTEAGCSGSTTFSRNRPNCGRSVEEIRDHDSYIIKASSQQNNVLDTLQRSPLQEISPNNLRTSVTLTDGSGSFTSLDSAKVATPWSLVRSSCAVVPNSGDLTRKQEQTPVASLDCNMAKKPKTSCVCFGGADLQLSFMAFQSNPPTHVNDLEACQNESLPLASCISFERVSDKGSRHGLHAGGVCGVSFQEVSGFPPPVRNLSSDFVACTDLRVDDKANYDIYEFRSSDCDLSTSKMLEDEGESSSRNHKRDLGTELTGPRTTGRTIFCCRCEESLLRVPWQQKHAHWQKLTMKKKFLQGLISSFNVCKEFQNNNRIEMLVCKKCILHPLLVDYNPVMVNETNHPFQSSNGIWVEEDGCVFKPLFCPWCKNGPSCIGAHVLAANCLNTEFLDMALLFVDSLKISYLEAGSTPQTCQGKQEQELHIDESLSVCKTPMVPEKWFVPSTNPLANKETSTHLKQKLKLPKRDYSEGSIIDM